MKKLIIPLAILVALVATYVQMEAKEVRENPNVAVFKWINTMHDFGEIPTGNPVTHKFTFTNTGDIPLVISSAKASCGCTVADYTKEAIAPGAEAARSESAGISTPNRTTQVKPTSQSPVVQAPNAKSVRHE